MKKLKGWLQKIGIGKKTIVRRKGSELNRAINYLKISGLTFVPDLLVTHLGLKITGATLSRKLRAASIGSNPEVLRSYYINGKGRRIAEYTFNTKVVN
jgi:hypothetical protein